MTNRATTFARKLRGTATDAESLLWRQLRAHRLERFKFRRQQPLGPYIVDYVRFGERLIVEVDGGQHLDSAADARRDAWLREQGFTVLRVWNNDVLLKTDAVLEHIASHLPLCPGPSPARGEGSTRENRP
jgi:very-short-patch-repair endonuclease